MTPGVCYVLASRDADGDYLPEEMVYTEFEEAVGDAALLLAEDPACDPKVLQVILDPGHPSLSALRIADAIEDEIVGTELLAADDPMGAEVALQTLARAKEIALQEGEVVHIADIDQSGKE